MTASSYTRKGGENLINRILVPLDGSEYADKALDWALDLAEKYNASIELLTVIPLLGPFTTCGIEPLFGPSLKELQEQAGKMLAEALKKAKKSKPNLKISTKVLEGRPSDKIVETAKEENFDLIVMGSRGLGGVKEFFLGSVSDRVADEAPCPVVIVK
jgi:nucleotide-binding universal stress UspA family protein